MTLSKCYIHINSTLHPMTKILICLLLLNFQNLKAQSLKWFEGSLVLSSCEVLVGEIAFQPQHDLILFQIGSSRMVYPAFRLKSLYLFDNEANINRRYVSLRERSNARTSFHLYEVVTTGQVEVLRRMKVNSLSTSNSELNYNYFIKYNDAMVPLKKFGRKIFPKLISSSDGKLDDYVSTHNLHKYNMANAIQIIEHYNRLVKSPETLASNSDFDK